MIKLTTLICWTDQTGRQHTLWHGVNRPRALQAHDKNLQISAGSARRGGTRSPARPGSPPDGHLRVPARKALHAWSWAPIRGARGQSQGRQRAAAARPMTPTWPRGANAAPSQRPLADTRAPDEGDGVHTSPVVGDSIAKT